MDTDTTVLLTKREAPMIGGSVAAFYALVIVLVLVILVASTAVIYLALEERAYRKSWIGKKVTPDDGDLSRKVPNLACMKWYKCIQNLLQRKQVTKAYPRGRGWVQAGTRDEWEWDPENEPTPPMTTVSTTLMQPKPYDHSLNTGESSTACSAPEDSRMNSFSSDRSLTMPFDVPVRTFTDVHAPSPKYPICGIQSSLITSSFPSSTSHSYQPSWVISSVTSNPVTISTSPAPITASPHMIEVVPSQDISQDTDNGVQVPLQTPTSINTFSGGSKFIEAL